MAGTVSGSLSEVKTLPRTSLAGLPFGRRKRSAHDFAPDGCSTRYNPMHAPSGISRRFVRGLSLATAATVNGLDISPPGILGVTECTCYASLPYMSNIA